MKLTLREQLISGLFAALIAVASQIVIPLGLVPFSLQTLMIGLTASLLGRRVGTWSIIIYLLLGLIGLPVFAGGASGFGVLFGPTGGYLIGFIFASLLIGTLQSRSSTNYISTFSINLLGFMVALVFGTAWLTFAANLTIPQGIASGFVPFILPEAAKATIITPLVVIMKKRLGKLEAIK